MSALINRLRSRVIASVAVSAVVLGGLVGSATPARASDDALIKFLLGATAVAIIVHSASRSQGRASPPRGSYGHALPQHCRETLAVHRRHIEVYNARCLHNAGLRNLPQQCHEIVRTNHGNRGVYGARCLEKNYQAQRPSHQSKALPNWCTINYVYRGQRHRGYSASCLHGEALQRLPATCRVKAYGGDIYSASCLTEHGYRPEHGYRRR